MKNKLILAVSLILITMTQVFAQDMRDPFIPLYPTGQSDIPASIAHTQTTAPTQEPIFNERIIKLTSIDAKEAMKQLQQVGPSLLSKKGLVNYHQPTNSLLVKDIESRLSLIEEWIKQLDIPKQQVQITAHIISSSRTALQELGLEWGMLSGSPNNNRYQHYNRYNSLSGQFNFNLLKIGEGILELKLNALEKENLLSIIASPRLIASHKHPARY